MTSALVQGPMLSLLGALPKGGGLTIHLHRLMVQSSTHYWMQDSTRSSENKRGHICKGTDGRNRQNIIL